MRPLAAVVVALLVVGACGAPAPPVVTSTVLAGSDERPVDGSARVAVDGVRLAAPDRLTAVEPAAATARAAAAAGGSTLVMSNYSTALGRYDGDLAAAMLSDPAAQAVVVDQLVRAADGFDGVQVSLFGLASPTSEALVSFAGALSTTLPAATTVSLTVIASTDFGGYRERGYDVEALDEQVDRLVLQTYEPGEADRPPQPIDDAAGIVEEIDYLVSVVDADTIDLGVSPLAGVDAETGLRLATDAGLHGVVVGSAGPVG